ncbi:MAG: hypothetical protein KGL53_01445 [Elusimicrobia bacterium]|nr:hypothetical protein [Elusimicrobiota bacterium]
MTTRRLLSACAAALLSVSAAGAAAPGTMEVQGRLLDPATGAPRTQSSVDITSSLYDAPTGGTLLWSEGPITQTLTHGVFDAELGESVPLSSSVFQGGDAWLEMKVETETLSPRQRLAAQPWALRAAAADTLEPGSTDYLADGDPLQSGATFYVSSGSVDGAPTVYGTLTGAGDLEVDGALVGSGGTPLTSASGLLDASALDPATQVPDAALDPSSVTKLGNVVNAPNGLLGLDAAGHAAAARLDSSYVTEQGSTFNGPSELGETDGQGALASADLDVSSAAKLGAGGTLPASLLDASSVTLQGGGLNEAGSLLLLDGGALVPDQLLDVSSVAKLDAGGLVPDSLLDPSSVTLQGNASNGPGLLARMDASGTLAFGASGAAQYSLTTSSSVNVTGTGAKVLENGAALVPQGAILISTGACPSGYSEYTALQGYTVMGNCPGCAAGSTAGTAFTTNAEHMTHSHVAGATTGGSLRTGGFNSRNTDTQDTTMPYIQVRFCRKT